MIQYLIFIFLKQRKCLKSCQLPPLVALFTCFSFPSIPIFSVSFCFLTHAASLLSCFFLTNLPFPSIKLSLSSSFLFEAANWPIWLSCRAAEEMIESYLNNYVFFAMFKNTNKNKSSVTASLFCLDLKAADMLLVLAKMWMDK